MSKFRSQITVTDKATGDSKELLSAGVNINIPPKTWLYMGLAIGVPAVIICLLLIFKDVINKH